MHEPLPEPGAVLRELLGLVLRVLALRGLLELLLGAPRDHDACPLLLVVAHPLPRELHASAFLAAHARAARLLGALDVLIQGLAVIIIFFFFFFICFIRPL
eukprot:15447327-Alexandrium_andersonii.AAC.1